MLARRPPFVVRNVTDIIGRDPNLNPPPLAAEIGAPASLDTVLAAGLAYRVDRRPPTAAILADALDVVATEMERSQGIAAPPSETRTVLTPAEPRRPQPVPPPVGVSGVPSPGDPYSSATGAPYSAATGAPYSSATGAPYSSATGVPGTMSPPSESSGFPSPSLPSPMSSPAPSGPVVGPLQSAGPQPGGQQPGRTGSGERPRRSRAAFIAMVVLACAALFALSLLITVVLLQ
jgi:hypothetical protein